MTVSLRNSEHLDEWPADAPPDTTDADAHIVLWTSLDGTQSGQLGGDFDNLAAATVAVNSDARQSADAGTPRNYVIRAKADAERDGHIPTEVPA